MLLRAGYGMADLEMGVPVEPEMVFRIGSLSKHFTAAAVLMLVEEGRLDLGRRVPVAFSSPDRFHHPQNLNFGRFERNEIGEIAGVRLTPMVGPQEWVVRTARPIPEEKPIEQD